MKRSLFISLFLLHFSFSSEAQTYADLPGPENVLVVYKLPDPNNSADTISQAVMNYYKDARQIPNSNIVALDRLFDDEIYDPETQTSHSIIIDQQGEIIKDNTILSYNPINRHSWIYFVDRIAEPIAHHLRTTIVNGDTLKNTIRFIVLCKGVPFRILTIPDDGSSCNQNVPVDGLLCFLGEDINNPYHLMSYLNMEGATGGHCNGTYDIENPYYNVDPNFSMDHGFIPNHYSKFNYDLGRDITLSYLITHLDATSLDVVKRMIDSSITAINSKDYDWFIDSDPTPCAGGPQILHQTDTKNVFDVLGITNYFIDDNEIVYTSHPNDKPVMSYISNGTHTSDGTPCVHYFQPDFIQSQLEFTYIAGSVFNTAESFNVNTLGTYPPIRRAGAEMGQLPEFFYEGGTVGIGQVVHGPSTGGIINNDAVMLPSYALGYSFIEAAYLGLEHLTATRVMVGDPLTRIFNPCEPLVLASNTSISSGDIDCNIIVPEGITLTITHGSGVSLHRNTGLKVYGNLVVANQVILNFNNYSMLKIFEGGTLTAETGSNIIFNDKSLLDNEGTIILNPNLNLTLNDNSKFNSSGKLEVMAGCDIVDNSSEQISITGGLFVDGTMNDNANFNFILPYDQLVFVNGDTLKLNYCTFNSGHLAIVISTDNTKLLLIENSKFNNSSNPISIYNYQLAGNLNAKLLNVQIENFTSAGINPIGLNNLEIENCQFISSYPGSIGIETYNNNLVVNNSNFNVPYGIVRGGRVDENIKTLNSENITIINCTFNPNPSLEFGSSTAISLTNDDINVASLSVKYCSISGFNTGVSLLNLHNLEPYIRNNVITNFDLFGISATVGNIIRVLDNNISSSTTISSDAKTGIFISNISNPILFRNTIQLAGLNEIEGAGIGLFSSNGVIRANTISGFRNGIELGGSSPNIGSNTITNNQNYGIYIGPDSYPNLSTTFMSEDKYPLTGYNTIKENGMCNPFPGYSEIYLSSSYAQLKGGCNIIADDRYDPSLQCNNNYLIDGDHVAETIDARANYWGETNHHNPEGRFGQNISVNYEGYLLSPCLYSRGSNLLLFTTPMGEVFDTVYSDAVTPTGLTDIEIKYSEANEFYYANQFTQAKQKFLEIIQLYGNNKLCLQAYTRLLEIAGLESNSSEQFLQLKDFYIQKASAQSDSLITSSLTHLSNLCLVSAKEYISAINNFEEIVQQNPNTDLAFYRQIDALTTSSLLTSDSTLSKMVLAKYKIEDISGYTNILGNLLRTRGKGGLDLGGEVIPTTYCLYQNYPNPFNPITTIKFDLPKDGLVTLDIYDILGRRITILVNENRTAGSYEQVFDASSLASGVYVYKLQAGDFINSKKMIFLK